ncbi:MAG: PrpR N-terminal domain-containing protein [Enterocloster sp.]
MNEGFDILISRGRDRELIRKMASIPVIEITLSINDILRAILLVGNLTEAYAVVG